MEDSPLSPTAIKSEPVDIPSSKKPKMLPPEEMSPLDFYRNQQMLLAAQLRNQNLPAFRPWDLLQQQQATTGTTKRVQMLPFNLPFNEQFTEPPVLQNPDRVVRLTDTQRFETNYQPNVALAPRKGNFPKERNTANGVEKLEHVHRSSSIERTVVAMIKQEPEIKQEPPSTPPDIQSPEPRYSPQSAATSSQANTMNNNNPTTPVSPELSQSGSNEITSSTSPVPAINNIVLNNDSASIKKHESITSPPIPASHLQQMERQLSQQEHQILRRGTPIPTENIHHRSHQISPLVKTNGSCPVVSTLAGSELELSTDTDDESVAGEPDSSNTPYEIPSEFLKDVRPDHREKIIIAIKSLIQESELARRENEHLRHELQKKNDHIDELIQKYDALRHQFEQHHYEVQAQQNRSLMKMEPTVITTRPEINYEVDRRNGYSNDKQTSEIIIKPFKKSLRRSPEDTVVIMQPKRDEIKILTNGELVRSTVN